MFRINPYESPIHLEEEPEPYTRCDLEADISAGFMLVGLISIIVCIVLLLTGNLV